LKITLKKIHSTLRGGMTLLNTGLKIDL